MRTFDSGRTEKVDPQISSPSPGGGAELFWQQAKYIDTGGPYAGTAGVSPAGNTVGCVYYVMKQTTITGIQFYWPAAAGAKTVRASLWENTPSGRLAFVDVAVPATSGVITATFAAPYVVTGANIGDRLTASIWVTDDSEFVYYSQPDSSVFPGNLSNEPSLVGPNILLYAWASGGGDDRPTGLSFGGFFRYAVDLIIG
jgi:hypothetical protein